MTDTRIQRIREAVSYLACVKCDCGEFRKITLGLAEAINSIEMELDSYKSLAKTIEKLPEADL